MRLTTLALILAATPAFAFGDWTDDPPVKDEPPTEEPAPEPEPPTVTPEPPPPVDLSRPTDSWADRNSPKPISRPLPCCIRDGQLVTTPFLFMSHERALKVCQRAKATGAALIYACPDQALPEAVK